jgi:hypothetical protein
MCNAENASVYFSEIKSIDKHNIFTVLKNGEERLVRLAYLRTPILGEFKHDITHSFLRKKLLNKWVRISELPGTGRAKVYRAIIRDNQQKIINVQMASRGLGIPVTIEQPPLAILKASKIAKEQNLGVWQNSEQFKKDRKNTEGENFLAYLESVKKTLASQKDKNNQIFIGNKKTKEFSPMKCVKNFNKAETVVFATKHVGLHRKYTFIPCPKENLPPK